MGGPAAVVGTDASEPVLLLVGVFDRRVDDTRHVGRLILFLQERFFLIAFYGHFLHRIERR